jgi:hypothetical protein
MTTFNFDDTGEPFTPGTRVRLRDSTYGVARIAEYRGPLGPKGARVYRVELRRRPPLYTEVLEEQLELVQTLPKETPVT